MTKVDSVIIPNCSITFATNCFQFVILLLYATTTSILTPNLITMQPEISLAKFYNSLQLIAAQKFTFIITMRLSFNCLLETSQIG